MVVPNPDHPLSRMVNRSVLDESANTNPLPVPEPLPVKENLADGVEEANPMLPFFEMVRVGIDEVA